MECIKIETNPIVKENLTILEMKAEIERLTQENQMLKCNNELLHNIIENQNAVDSVKNNNTENTEGGWSEEEFDMVMEGYAKDLENYSLR